MRVDRWRVLDRDILRLALPAFGALVAQPIFLLVDAAVVGTLGTAPLAGLGAAGTVVTTLVGLCVFLAFATTASVARLVGAGDWARGVAQGLDGVVVGIGLGAVLGAVVYAGADVFVDWLGVEGDAAAYAGDYLRVVAVALPALLATTAGLGVLRGLQDTRTTLVVTVTAVVLNTALCLFFVLGLRWGVRGSALATALAETAQAVAYVVVLARVARRHGVPLRPSGLGVLAAVRDGLPLMWRTVVLRAVFVVAAGVAARLGEADLAAYHVSLQVWNLLALTADALAIAAQALLGLRLGAGDVAGARQVADRLVRLGFWLGLVLAAVLAALSPVLPAVFSADPLVRSLITGSLLVVALQQPLASVVFALDGVLIGAGDGPWLAGAGTVMVLAFLPAAWWVLAADAGVVALWWALTWFMVVRGALLWWRSRRDTWLRPGAVRT